jgi:hypothetical protein
MTHLSNQSHSPSKFGDSIGNVDLAIAANAFTIPAPVPCEAPVTMAVLREPMVAYLENVSPLGKIATQADQKSAPSTMR